MSKPEIKIAVIGCGKRAVAYAKTMPLTGLMRVTALSDPFAERTRVIKEAFGDNSIKTYTDYRRMIDDGDFDAAIVCTEPEYQARLSCEVMRAGKDVYSEVPVTFSLDDCWELALAVEQTGRLYYLGEQMRHAPIARYWQWLISQGRIGAVLFAEGHYLHTMPAHRYWRNTETGGFLTWEEAAKTEKKAKTRAWTMLHPILYGPHELSPLLKIIDDRITRVSCFSTPSPNQRLTELPFPGQNEPYTRPDMEVAMMSTAKGAILRFAGGTVAVSENHWWHILGTQGELETRRGSDEAGYSYFFNQPAMHDGQWHFPRTPEAWFELRGEPPEELARRLNIALPEIARGTDHGGLDFAPVYDFATCLVNGTKPDIDVYQALNTAAPCIVAAASAEQGGATLAVPDFRPGPNRKRGEPPVSGKV